jgi:hypothetical protein
MSISLTAQATIFHQELARDQLVPVYLLRGTVWAAVAGLLFQHKSTRDDACPFAFGLSAVKSGNSLEAAWIELPLVLWSDL